MFPFMFLLFMISCVAVPASCLVSIFFGESQRKREVACQRLIVFCALAIGIGLYVHYFVDSFNFHFPLSVGLLLILFGAGELFLLRRKR